MAPSLADPGRTRNTGSSAGVWPHLSPISVSHTLQPLESRGMGPFLSDAASGGKLGGSLQTSWGEGGLPEPHCAGGPPWDPRARCTQGPWVQALLCLPSDLELIASLPSHLLICSPSEPWPRWQDASQSPGLGGRTLPWVRVPSLLCGLEQGCCLSEPQGHASSEEGLGQHTRQPREPGVSAGMSRGRTCLPHTSAPFFPCSLQLQLREGRVGSGARRFLTPSLPQGICG